MRLASFVVAHSESWGTLNDDGSVVDFRAWGRTSDHPVPPTLLDALRAHTSLDTLLTWSQAAAVDRAQHIPAGEVQLRAPFPEPRRNIFCLGPNYADHAEESDSATAPDQPVYFTKATTTTAPPVHTLRLDPSLSSKVDWEIELAVVIARGGSAIEESAALGHVLGYTAAIDFSARDVQAGRPDGQWFLGKSFDGFCPMGPSIVTTDEISDPQTLDLALSVNGVQKQSSNTSLMTFPVAHIIADLSRYVTLLPGDIISTGTPGGVGNARTPPEHLRPGDRVTGSIARIGDIMVEIAR